MRFLNIIKRYCRPSLPPLWPSFYGLKWTKPLTKVFPYCSYTDILLRLLFSGCAGTMRINPLWWKCAGQRSQQPDGPTAHGGCDSAHTAPGLSSAAETNPLEESSGHKCKWIHSGKPWILESISQKMPNYMENYSGLPWR